MNKPLLAAIAFVAGLLAGYLLFAPEPPGDAAEEQAAAPAPPPAAPAPVHAARKTQVAARTAGTGVPPAPAPPASPPGAADATALARRVAQLEAQLLQERAGRPGPDELPGPIPPRRDLPPRFSTEALGASVQAGLKELGKPAQVTSVDCTEFPCIVYGEGFGGFDEAQALFKASALGAYAGDERRVWGWTREAQGEAPARDFFALAFYPSGEGARTAELNRRMDARVIQMKDATR